MKAMDNSQKIQETPDANSQSISHVQKGDPALEFIKHVCAVLALDQNVQHEVLVLNVFLASLTMNKICISNIYWHRFFPSGTESLV